MEITTYTITKYT